MGQSLVLQAFPAESRLYAQVATDPKAGFVFAHLLAHGGWPWAWAANRTNLSDVLDDLATCKQLGSRAEVDRVLDDLVAGLEEARAEHPGLEGRRTHLIKTQEDIEKRLSAEFRRWGRADADEFAQAMVFGAAHLTPPWVEGAPGVGLRVVPPEAVREAAQWLAEVTPEALFDPAWGKGLWEDFRDLRALYAAAAEQNEAVMVGSEYTGR